MKKTLANPAKMMMSMMNAKKVMDSGLMKRLCLQQKYHALVIHLKDKMVNVSSVIHLVQPVLIKRHA